MVIAPHCSGSTIIFLSNRWWGCANTSHRESLFLHIMLPIHGCTQSCILCTAYYILFTSMWIYRGTVCQAAWFSKFSSRPCQSTRWAHNCQRLWKRQESTQHSLRLPAALFCMEEPLSMFILIRWDSCGHLQPSCAYVSPRLSKPAPFIILQQPCSNWAASTPAVTHHLLHIEPEEIQM